MLGIRKRIATYKEMADFSYILETEQNATIGIVKSTLKNAYNGIMPIKIKGHTITGHMAYFITDQDSTEGRDPNINIINGIHKIKGNLSMF